MSSNCPPQLRLSLHGENGTSYKRSFEQYDFDLDTPFNSTGGGGGGGEAGGSSSGIGSGSGNERNKRARSQNSFPDSEEGAGSSSSPVVRVFGTAVSSEMNIEDGSSTSLSGLSATRPHSFTDNVSNPPSVLASFPGPPRLPTPIPLDIEMSALDESQSTAPAAPTSSLGSSDRYRISLERFNNFDSEISALRQTPSPSSTPPSSLPTVSTIRADDNNGVNPRLHPRGRSDIPGLQVFSLGELRTPEGEIDRREASRLQPVFRMPRDPVVSFPDRSIPQSTPRESSQRSISTLDRDDGMNSHSPIHNQLPSTSPRRISSPLSLQEEMRWWSSQLYDDISSGSLPFLRADASSRAPLSYSPQNDWFDTSSQAPQRDHLRGNPLLDAHATVLDRPGDAVRSRAAEVRRMSSESSDGERSTVDFPSAVQASTERHRNIVRSFRPRSPSSSFSEGGRHRHQVSDQNLPLSFSRVDWSPYERSDDRSMIPETGHQSGTSHTSSQLHPEIVEDEEDEEDAWTPTAERPSRLPMVDIDVRPPSFVHRSDHLGTQSQASLDMAGSPVSNSADSQRILGHHTSTSSIFLRRPVSPTSNANTFGRSSLRGSRLPSTANTRRIESPDNGWSMPQSYPIDDSFRQQSAVQSRMYSSHVGASDFSAFENAADLRRRLARSQMLRNLPVGTTTGHEEFNDDPWDDPDSLNISDGSSPRADRRVPWVPFSTRARLRSETQFNGSALRSRPVNPLLRQSEISNDFTVRESDDPDDHDIHAFDSFSSPSGVQFTNDVMPGSHDRNSASIVGHGPSTGAAFSQTAALFTSSVTSSLSGRALINQEPPSRSRAFWSGTDGISTRPMRVQSPIAWEGDTHSIDYGTSPGRPSLSHPADLEMGARASVRRSSLADIHSFQSPSPSPPPSPPLVSRVRRPLAEPPRTVPSTAYGHLDLTAYHEGPFRASLQRFVDTDRLRSRLNRLEPMIDAISSDVTPSASSHSLQAISPLLFEDDDYVSAETFVSQQAANSPPHFASSPAMDPELRYLRGVREERLNRDLSHRTSGSPSAQSRHNTSGYAVPRHVRNAAVLAARMENSANSFREAGYRTQRDRLNAYDARMQAYWNQIQSGDSVDTTRDVRPTSPSLRSPEAELRAQSVRIQDRNALILAHMAAQAQTRLDVENLNVTRGGGIRQTTTVSAADRLNVLPEHHIFGRHQSDRSAESERSLVASNDNDTLGSRSWAARLRYARRAHVHRPSQPLEPSGTLVSGSLSIPARQNRSSSLSPAHSNRNSERPTTSTATAERRLRSMRERAQRGREPSDFPRAHLVNHMNRIGRHLGDYVRDEDFDASYENLLSLASIVGDARPKATPNYIIATLPTGFYKDWQTVDSDQRCPICLDDYNPMDPVLKLSNCLHWLHKSCLEQWLRSANTCPVCRKRVEGSRSPHYQQRGTGQEPTPSGSGSSRRRHRSDNSVPDGFPPPWRFWD